MSAARSSYLVNITGVRNALELEILAAGSVNPVEPPAIVILRRGVLIASLIALESFIRDRTAELLTRLASWPASFDDLPSKFREAALLHALTHIQRYATMLKRNDEDYESEIVTEVGKMSSTKSPNIGFTRFVAGDFTGNLSEQSLNSLLASFAVSDCWEEFRKFSSSLGLGTPSVREMLTGLVRNRHRSAHVAGYAPSAVDILSLPDNLVCIGICFDTAMTSAVECAVRHWSEFKKGKVDWRSATDIYFVDSVAGQRLRLSKLGRTRALKLIDTLPEARDVVRKSASAHVSLLVSRDAAQKPKSWELLV